MTVIKVNFPLRIWEGFLEVGENIILKDGVNEYDVFLITYKTEINYIGELVKHYSELIVKEELGMQFQKELQKEFRS